MSTDRDFTNVVRSWIQTDQHESADRVLSVVFDRLDTRPQRRPLWRAWRNNLMNGTFKLIAAGTAAVLVAAIGIGIYLNQPNVGPAGSPSFSLGPTTGPATDSLLPSPTTAAVPAPFVVFVLRDGGSGSLNDDLWAMRADGTGAQELSRDFGFGNVAWYQDGTRLLIENEGANGVSHIYLADVGDVIGPLVDTGFSTGADTACNDKSDQPAPCQNGDFTIAPDGQRVAFTQRCTYSVPGCGFVTILDLRTGDLTELTATLEQGHKGYASYAAWSPDGTQIAYIREPDRKPGGGVADSNLWLIDADGQNPHKIELAVSRVTAPRWSPDGGTIALMSDLYSEGPQPGSETLAQDVYTVKADGTDLRQLTTDGRSIWPEWTSSGQIRFRDGIVGGPTDTMRYLTMDADGSNVTELVDLEGLIQAMTPESSTPPIPGDLGPAFLWQPGSSWYESR